MNMGGTHSRKSVNARKSVNDRLRHAFRERQVYVRSDNALRYMVIRPWHLMSAACLLCMVFAWTTITSLTFVLKERNVINAIDTRADTRVVQAQYEGRLASIQSAVTRLSSKLMLDQDAYIARVDELRGDFIRLTDRHRRLEVFFKQGWLPVQATDSQPTGSTKPKQHSGLQSEDQAALSLIRLTAAPQGGYKTDEEAQRPLDELRDHLVKFKGRQVALVDRIIVRGEKKAAVLRTAIADVGLDPAQVTKRMKLPLSFIGGPLLPVQKGEKPQDDLDRKLLSAHEKLIEVIKLRRAISLMPVRLPFKDGYRLTSGFGFRKDPFKNVLARHTGVDLMAPYGTPIKAAATGLIIRAEMDDAYGRVVDIQHDNGIMTRYAHMSVIEVKVGDRVAAHHVIGRVGTSGRSTGPHVHYETRVNDKPIDPYQFLRIVRDVF